MLKTHMAACLVATAFAAAPAFGQAPPSAGTDRPTATGAGAATSGSNSMQPAPAATGSPPTGAWSGTQMGAPQPSPTATTAAPPAAPTNPSASAPSVAGTTAATMPSPGAPAPMPSSGGTTQGRFVTQLQDGQVMASRLIGTTVVSASNESVGDVNDVILDRQGRIVGAVIGVGGFLGIGEKNVAVPFEALEMTAARPGGAGMAGQGGAMPGNVSSTGATTSGNDQQNTASNRQTATTGNTGNAGAGGAVQANGNNDGGVPDRIMLRMTKADLQAAPSFQTSRRGSEASGVSTQRP